MPLVTIVRTRSRSAKQECEGAKVGRCESKPMSQNSPARAQRKKVRKEGGRWKVEGGRWKVERWKGGKVER